MKPIELHYNIKKASKKKAFEIAETLLSEAIEKGVDEKRLSELESLYKYFMPSAPKKAKTLDEFMARFCGKNDVRWYLNDIIVQDGYAYASDGHILCRTPSSKEDGVYCKVTGNIISSHTQNIPSLDRLLTQPFKNGVQDPIKVTTKNMNTFKDANKKDDFFRISDNRAINMRLLERCINGADSFTIEPAADYICSEIHLNQFPEVEILIMSCKG